MDIPQENEICWRSARRRAIEWADAGRGQVVIEASFQLVLGEQPGFVGIPGFEPAGKAVAEFFAGEAAIFVGVKFAQHDRSEEKAGTEGGLVVVLRSWTRPDRRAIESHAVGFAAELIEHFLMADGDERLDGLSHEWSSAGASGRGLIG